MERSAGETQAPEVVVQRGVTNTRSATRPPLGRQRAEFLRNCRARIKPADVGLPDPQRRRTAGLRREDVAALSGVSVAWYTWLEQGRDMRVSDEVLERICLTFKLTDDERIYLFSLVQQRAPRVQGAPRFDVPPDIERLVTGMAIPAIARNLRWDVLAWNELNSRVFRDYSRIAPGDRNLLELLFGSSSYDDPPEESQQRLRRIVAKLKVDYSASGSDRRFELLIQRMERNSALFRNLWRSPDVNAGSYGIHRFRHREYGDVAFEHVSCTPEGHPTVRVVMCMPADARTRTLVAQLNQELTHSAETTPE
jgi:transcriptional regulator with XRE-family HTH domain